MSNLLYSNICTISPFFRQKAPRHHISLHLLSCD
uniref:Uncharacterized protein n=1 Tax=Arundo donax TaxID=35708 RepID=A0A0A8Z086_ARUDO